MKRKAGPNFVSPHYTAIINVRYATDCSSVCTSYVVTRRPLLCYTKYLRYIETFAQISSLGVLVAMQKDIICSALHSENITLHPKNIRSVITFNAVFSDD